MSMIIEHSDSESYRKCYLLETMKTFIHYNTEVVSENQNIIMQELCNQQYNNVLILWAKEDHQKQILKDYK